MGIWIFTFGKNNMAIYKIKILEQCVLHLKIDLGDIYTASLSFL